MIPDLDSLDGLSIVHSDEDRIVLVDEKGQGSSERVVVSANSKVGESGLEIKYSWRESQSSRSGELEDKLQKYQEEIVEKKTGPVEVKA